MKKNAAAVQLGRLGGKARAKALTDAERRAIAIKAISARWGMEYLYRMPKAVPADRVLVHNHVKPSRFLGRGFRIWLSRPDARRWAICDCGWAPELGQHFQVKKYAVIKAARSRAARARPDRTGVRKAKKGDSR